MTLWPRSLVGRNLLLLVSLTIAGQLCALFIFIFAIQRPRVDAGAALEAAQIRVMGQLLAALPAAERQRQVARLNGGATPPAPTTAVPLTRAGGYVMQRFVTRLRDLVQPGVLVQPDRDAVPARLWVRLPHPQGADWLVLPVAPVDDGFLPWSVALLVVSQAALPLLGAWLIHLRTRQPLLRLARAAATVENGKWPAPVPLDGPLELVTVAASFNRMLAALAELEGSRADMLAGISHDIRSPLTKLRMAVTAPEAFEAPRASAERFIDEIDLVLGQFIDFARGADSERPVVADLNELIDQLAGGYASMGHGFTLALGTVPPFAFRAVGMQRVLMNLMQNAVLYGLTGLAVRTWCADGAVYVAVEDRGPGVPAALLATLKQPFQRGAHASSDHKGTGLGLAIAERIATHSGGSLALSARRNGGLRALLRLPLAPG